MPEVRIFQLMQGLIALTSTRIYPEEKSKLHNAAVGL